MPDITIIYNQKQQTFSCENGTNLLFFLQQNRIPIQAPCAGNGTCGKCKVTMTISGKSSTVSACQTILEQDCIVELLSSSLIPDQEAGSGTQTSAFSACDWNYGIAVDLGTTTVVSALVSLDTGQVLDVRREWNAQISYGSDVISRLKYIQDHSNGLSLLSDLIQRQILDMMDQQCKKAGISSTRIKNIVIAAGGGGIPIVKKRNGYQGVDAVIDKDKTSAKLAIDLNADIFLILTAVEKVCINFGKENEQKLNLLTVKQAKEYMKNDEFKKGSMLPKIEACLDYVTHKKDGQAIITSLSKLKDALLGRTGTIIVRKGE